MLTELGHDHSTRHNQYWKFRCDCGKEHIAGMGDVRRGKINSCGCQRHKGLPPSQVSFNQLLSGYRAGANARGYTWELSVEDFKNLTSGNCVYCGEPPRNWETYSRQRSPHITAVYVYNGIDRIDNSLGYTKENCVSCCTMCNYMKSAYTRELFLNHIKKIYEYNKERNII